MKRRQANQFGGMLKDLLPPRWKKKMSLSVNLTAQDYRHTLTAQSGKYVICLKHAGRWGGEADMICDDCHKRRRRNYRGTSYHDCVVLQGKMPVWGESCTAFTDDPGWETTVEKAVSAYQNERDGRLNR